MDIQKTYLFESVNGILSRRIPQIAEEIQSKLPDLDKCNLFAHTKFSLRENSSQLLVCWRIYIDFKDVLYDEEGIISFLGGVVSIEEHPSGEMYYFNPGNIYNGLNDELPCMNKIEIKKKDVNNPQLVNELIEIMCSFLNKLPHRIYEENLIFNKIWLNDSG